MSLQVATEAGDALRELAPVHGAAPNPRVVEEHVRQHSLVLSAAVDLRDLIELDSCPPEILRSVPRRQRQFAAGRACASAALAALDPDFGPELARVRVGRGSGGAPLWPAGITGSITHTDGFASAAVARTRDAASVGIDTEPIIAAARANVVSTTIAWPCEQALARHAGCDRLEALTLVFSAKESIFKCLYPVVGRFFDFHDARVVEVDAASRTFTVRLVKTLAPDFAAGTILAGRFEIDGRLIHTGVTLPPPAARQ